MKLLRQSFLILGAVSALGLLVVVSAVYIQAYQNNGWIAIHINDFNEMLLEIIIVVPIMFISIIYLIYYALTTSYIGDENDKSIKRGKNTVVK